MAVNECGYTISFLTWSRSSVRIGEGKGGNWAAGMSFAPALVCSSCTLTLRGFCYFDFLSSLTLLQMKSGRREGNFTDDLLPLLGLWTEGNGRISQLVCPFFLSLVQAWGVFVFTWPSSCPSVPLWRHFLGEDSAGLHVSGPRVSLYHVTLTSHSTSCLWVFLCLSSVSLWNLHSQENWAYILTCSTMYAISKLFL